MELTPRSAHQAPALSLSSENKMKSSATTDEIVARNRPRSMCQMFATLRTNFLTSQSRRTKIKIENAFCFGSTQIKGRTECEKNERLLAATGNRLATRSSFK
jgi:hypothetical protein